MTWKRELAFWAFMFLVMLWFMYGTIHVGTCLSENWGSRVAIESAK